MRTEIKYFCEICGSEFSYKESALHCESIGRADLNSFPVGLIHNDARKGFYKGITFCVADVIREGHRLCISLWACRTYNGDSLGKETVGGSSSLNSSGPADINHPTFKRMVRWLRKNRPKIKITVRYRGKNISLNQYLKLKKRKV